MVPLTEAAGPFHERFGIDVYTIFNMTEISSPIVSEPNPTKLGTCGKLRAGVDVRLVDANDCEVPIGAVGEMIVRTDRPWAMNQRLSQESRSHRRAWRNGWFHTGDAFRRDAEGYFYFVDRVKDAIRRRGENISSFRGRKRRHRPSRRARGRGDRRTERVFGRRGHGRHRVRAGRNHRLGCAHRVSANRA